MMKELTSGALEFFAMNFVQEKLLSRAKLTKIRPMIKFSR